MIDLTPSISIWVRWLISLALVCLLVIWYISDKNRKRLTLMRPILLPQLTTISYTDDTGKCNLRIAENYPLLPNNIDSCLRRANESLNKNIIMYNSQAEALINELNLKITNFVKQKIPDKWDITEPPEPMRYYTKDLNLEISNRIRFYNEKHYGKRPRFSLKLDKDGINRWKLSKSNNVLVASDNENEIIEIQKAIMEFFDAVIIDKRFKRLNEFFGQIKREHEIYGKEIERVLRDLKNGIWLNE